MSPFRTLTLILAAVASLAMGRPADAATVERYDQQGASSVCQATLPTQTASLRASPMGLTNQGTEMAFVTCTLQGDTSTGGRGTKTITADVSSSATTTTVVTCTLVDGLGVTGSTSSALYTTRSVTVLGGGLGGTIDWAAAEVAPPTGLISVPAVQCGLPPAATLHYVTRRYIEGIGT